MTQVTYWRIILLSITLKSCNYLSSPYQLIMRYRTTNQTFCDLDHSNKLIKKNYICRNTLDSLSQMNY